MLTTGQVTREWVAVHRKHHAKCETPDDPHSPQTRGLARVLLGGLGLYRAECQNRETVETYGKGTPDDWIENNLYARHRNLGLLTMLAIDAVLFGWVGLIIFAVQMVWIPFWAAGVINGIGHYWGYRNFETTDASRNIVPWGIVVGGEELHNNHHAFPTSAKFSVRRWEFDIGWLYIRAFSVLGLAKVNRVAPQPVIESSDAIEPSVENLKAIIVNRMHVLRDYTKQVTLPTLKAEKALANGDAALKRARKLLVRRPALLDVQATEKLRNLLADNSALKTVHEFRERLLEIWSGSNVSNEKLLQQLKDWCREAEESGIQALEEFAARIRDYQLAPQAV